MQIKALALVMTGLGLAGPATAFQGKLEAGQYIPDPFSLSGYRQSITVTDHGTGSSYTGEFTGYNFNVNGIKCVVWMTENHMNGNGFNFYGTTWRDEDGCHHFDFNHNLDAGEGAVCGSLPADFYAPYSPQ